MHFRAESDVCLSAKSELTPKNSDLLDGENGEICCYEIFTFADNFLNRFATGCNLPTGLGF